MANGPAFDEAVQFAKTVPKLSVGCHLVLTDGDPVLPSDQLASLTRAGHFRDGMFAFAARAIAGGMAADEITEEASAQIQKLQSAGIAVSHIDTHKHTHLFPRILRPLLRAAADCGVRAVRNPFGPRMPLRSSQLLARPGLWARYVEVRVLSAFAKQVPPSRRSRRLCDSRRHPRHRSDRRPRRNLVLRDRSQHSRRYMGIRLPSRIQRLRPPARPRRACANPARPNFEF